MKDQATLFRFNNGSQVASRAQNDVRQTQVNLASMHAPHEVDLFVVGLTIHKLVMKARARRLDLFPETLAPHCVGGKVTFYCDPTSPNSENPAVHSAVLRLATSHTMALGQY